MGPTYFIYQLTLARYPLTLARYKGRLLIPDDSDISRHMTANQTKEHANVCVIHFIILFKCKKIVAVKVT